MDDREMVRTLLGREPRGDFEVVVRDASQWPVVIRNAPLLDDGTPMPTRYWLVGEEAVRRVGHLEADGGVRRAERDIDPAEIAAAHTRYAAERDAALGADHVGPRPSGGVGGTREGVKCLHAHYAWFLAGGDDPVGRWVQGQLEGPTPLTVELDSADDPIRVRCPVPPSGAPWVHELPLSGAALATAHLVDDPPDPAGLADALGVLSDHLDDLVRAHPDVLDPIRVRVAGELARVIARVEVGADRVADPLEIDRDAAEDVFRTVVTEPDADRRHNPGLPPEHVRSVVPAACVLVAVMRRLHLDRVALTAARDTPRGGP